MIRTFLLCAAALLPGACTDATGGPGQPAPLTQELVPAKGDAPPEGPEGACWARDTTPAVIETQTEQVMVAPGDAVSPPRFRSTTRQKIVQDRRDVWFRTPCADELTVPFIASLQRALKARGLYSAPVTGRMDAATEAAIRRYQEPLGLDSDVLSLRAARDLGLVPADLADL